MKVPARRSVPGQQPAASAEAAPVTPPTPATPAGGPTAGTGTDGPAPRPDTHDGETPMPDPTDPATPAGPVLVEPPSAAELVEGAAGTWRAALVEAAGGSTLADVELLGDAALDLSAAHPSGIAQLFAGRETRLSNLVREGAARGTARRRARAVAARAGTYAQQYGIAPTYLAIGVASWTEHSTPDVATDDVAAIATATRESTAARPDGVAADDDAPAPTARKVRAPVLLRPVSLRARGTAESDYELTLEPSLEVNPVLARALRSRGALLDPGAVARSAFTGSGFDPRDAITRLTSLGTAVLDDFQLVDRIVVGTFVHPGQVLVDDLDRLASALDRHEVVAALAGVPEAVAALDVAVPEPSRGDRDPALERGVGDLDPAQQHVLDVVAGGSHVFVDAPADSDVTGTLAALVADAAAEGRTVLYVPGHRRAAVALRERLEQLGVGEVLLDVAPDAAWRAASSRRLMGAMTLDVDPGDPVATGELRRALVERRERLRGYVDGLHRVREPWGASAYDAFQALARLTAERPAPRTTVRLAAEVARTLDAERRAAVGAELREAAEAGAFTLRPVDTPWYGAALLSDAEAADALRRAERLAAEAGLARVERRIAEVAEVTGFTPATTLAAWAEQLEVLAGVRGALDVFQPIVFERSPADMVAATASKAWRAEHGTPMGYWLRRRLKKQAKDLLRPGPPGRRPARRPARRAAAACHLGRALPGRRLARGCPRASGRSRPSTARCAPTSRRSASCSPGPPRAPTCSTARSARSWTARGGWSRRGTPSPGCPSAPGCSGRCAPPAWTTCSTTWPRAGCRPGWSPRSSSSPGGAPSSSSCSPPTPPSRATTAAPSAGWPPSTGSSTSRTPPRSPDRCAPAPPRTCGTPWPRTPSRPRRCSPSSSRSG
ncbi:hypothetical protein [Cellulomonas sp. Y8]|uniref:hypothetical protein n=1 Tax=Cellulomonas sp. Y8 TaxID=2591145 RepID=UPI0011CC4A3B